MVVEAYGAWGAEAMESLSRLASHLAISSSKAKAAVLNSLYGRLNLNLQMPCTAMLCCLDALPRTCRLFRLGRYIYIIYMYIYGTFYEILMLVILYIYSIQFKALYLPNGLHY